MTHVEPGYHTLTDDHNFIFEVQDKAIFAFGGRGFKYMPYHGKRIYHLVLGNLEEGNKYQ